MLIGKIAGVKLRFNLLFLAICLLYIYLGLGLEILIIVTSVILHELAHLIIALLLGIKFLEVELLPFGGQAKVEDFTGLEPSKEVGIAIAGPLCSLSICAVFYFFSLPFYPQAISYLIKINLLLGLFNLLPALPLDGGRILRASLSPLLGFRKATSICAIIGKILAIIIAGYGGYLIYVANYGVNFIIIGILLYWAAYREKNLLMFAFMRYLINKQGELGRKGFLGGEQVISKKDTLIKDILHTSRPITYMLVFIVDDDNNVIGVKTEAELIETLLQKGPKARM